MRILLEAFGIGAPRSDAPPKVALCGIGGVGKTALADAFARQYASSFPGGMVWLDLGTNRDAGDQGSEHSPKAVLREQLCCWLISLGGRAADSDSLPIVTASIRHALTKEQFSKRGVLLVLDNVDTEYALDYILQSFPDCAVLATMRQERLAEWGRLSLVRLSGLTPDEAVDWMRRELGPEDPRVAHVENLLGHVEYHPLAIRLLIAGLTANRAMPPATLLAEMRSVPASSLGAPKHIPRSLADCFITSIARLPRDGRRPFLVSLASQSPVSFSLEAADYVSGCMDTSRSNSFLRELQRGGFVSETRLGHFKIHRLLRDHLRLHQGSSGLARVFRPSFELPSLAWLLARVLPSISAGTPNYDARHDAWSLRWPEGPSPDTVQGGRDALLSSLFRRIDQADIDALRGRLQVLSERLDGVNIDGVGLGPIYLDGAHLSGASMRGTDLSGDPARWAPRLRWSFRRIFHVALHVCFTFCGTALLGGLVLPAVGRPAPYASMGSWLHGVASLESSAVDRATAAGIGLSVAPILARGLAALALSGGRWLRSWPMLWRWLSERLLVTALSGVLCIALLCVFNLGGASVGTMSMVSALVSIMVAMNELVAWRVSRSELGGIARRLSMVPLTAVFAMAAGAAATAFSAEDVAEFAWGTAGILLVLGTFGSLESATVPFARFRGHYNNPEHALDLLSQSQTFLRRARLRQANLQGANLHGADLSRADLTEVDATRADLSNAILRGACLRGALLRGANFSSADLSGSDLRGACFDEANFDGADLRNVLLDESSADRSLLRQHSK